MLDVADVNHDQRHSRTMILAKQDAEDRGIEDIRQLGLARRGTQSSQAASVSHSLDEAVGGGQRQQRRRPFPCPEEGRQLKLEETVSSAIKAIYIE